MIDDFVIYDGQCPFCAEFILRVRIDKALSGISFIDAHTAPDIVARLMKSGYDIDEGMILSLNGIIYFGSECMHRLAMMTTSSDLFNKLNALIFRRPRIASLLYPIMRFFRSGALIFLGREKINKKREVGN